VISAPALEMLHRPVTAMVRAYGVPSGVATKDDGQHVFFGDGTSTIDVVVDDEATVHAFDVALPAGSRFKIDVEGVAHTLTFGTTTSLGARDELAADAETEGRNFRVFRRGSESAFVLTFDPKTSLLSHIVVGDRATLLRLGYLVDPQPLQPSFPFSAPKLRRSSVPDGNGAAATVLRLDLDRGGVVRTVAVVVPSTDAAYDAGLVKALGNDTYQPAKLAGRPIGASVLREVRH
jgi:hypothetical protein